MNKTEIFTSLSDQLGITKEETEHLYDTLFQY